MTDRPRVQIVIVARRVGPALPQLVKDEVELSQLQGRLEELLARHDGGDDVSAELRNLLGENKKVRNYRDRALREANAESVGAHALLPVLGPPIPIRGVAWRCPQCDLTFVQFDAGERVPRCKEHDVEFVRDVPE